MCQSYSPSGQSTIRILGCCGLLVAGLSASIAAEPGYFQDPQTGNVYRQVTRTRQVPRSEVTNTSRDRTIYRPEVVSKVRRENRTIYSPTVRYEWQPEWQNWWNPFARPTLAYRYVPRTYWETREETYEVPVRETRWVAQRETETVPQRVTRMEPETSIEYHLVHGQAAAVADATIASRLQPYRGSLPSSSPSTMMASSARGPASRVARLPGDEGRTSLQQGMRPSVLMPSAPPLANPGVTIATQPPLLPRLWR